MKIFESKAVRVGGAIAVLAAALWFALPYLIDVNQYRGLIQDQLKAKLKRDVALGPMELKVLPLSIRIEDFSVGEDPAIASKRPFARAKELRVRIGLLALLSGKVEVAALSLRQPEVEIVRKADGGWNFATLGSSSSEAASEKPAIDRLEIADGSAGFTDLGAARPERQQFDHIDIDLRDFGAGRRFKLDAEARLPGEGSIAWSGTEMSGKLKLSKAGVGAMQRMAKAGDDLDATVSGEVDIENATAAKGKIEVSNVRVKKSKLAFPLALQFDTSRDGKATEIRSAVAKIGATSFTMSGTLRDEAAALKIRTEKSPIDELLKLAAAFGGGADADMQAKGTLTADIAANGPLDKLAFNGKLEALGLEVRNAKWKEPVRIADLKLALSPTEIQSTPFLVEAGGTKLKGNFKVANYAGDASTVDASLTADNASIADLLHVGQAFGMAAPGVTGSGLLDLDVRIGGSTKKPRLSGKGRIENAQLNLEGVAKPVAVPKLDARFEEDGVTVDSFVADLAGSKLQGSASVSGFAAPVVKFALDIDKWNTAEMQKLFPPAKTEASGKKPSAFEKATGGGSVRIGSLVVNDVVLNQLSATCALNQGVLVLDPVKAELFAGSLQGRITADLRPAAPLVTVSARMDQVDANKLISAATPLKQTIFGKFTAETDLNLAANADMAKSLNGSLKFGLADGKLAGVNLLNEAAKVGRFIGWNAPQNAFTDFIKLGGTLKIVNGVAQTNDLDAQLNGARFSASGIANLVEQSLDMRLGMVLDSEFSKKVGGSQIGGFMATALADERGQLMIPTLLRGPFSKPAVLPDGEQFAKLKLKSVASPAGFKDTKEKVQGVIDLFRRKKDAPAAQGKQ